MNQGGTVSWGTAGTILLLLLTGCEREERSLTSKSDGRGPVAVKDGVAHPGGVDGRGRVQGPQGATSKPTPMQPTRWGKPAEGLQAGITFLGVIHQGNDTGLTMLFSVRNTGERRIRIQGPKGWWICGPASLVSPTRLDLAMGEKRLRYQGPQPAPPPNWPRRQDFVFLEPGEEVSGQQVLLSLDWGLASSKEVDVTFTFWNREAQCEAWDAGVGPALKIDGLWIGEAHSEAIRVSLENKDVR